MKTAVTVRFTSGREEKFEVQFWGGAGAQARLQAFVDNPTLVLKTGDELLIIPASAIECLSIKTQKGDDWSSLGGIRTAKRIK
jgi:hypothetical protein